MNDDVTLLAGDLASIQSSHAQRSSHVLVLLGGSAGERRIPIGRLPVVIGRTPPCDIVLAGTSISRQHCRVELKNNQASVLDLGSTNGTFVDGRRVTGQTALSHGSTLQVGSFVFHYECRTAKEVDEALASEREIQSASAYVNMLLPKPIPHGPVRANWLFLPCAKLGGNAFGYRFIDPVRFAGFMLDVAGVGTEAAMHSVAVLNLLRQPAASGLDFAEPSDVLAELNRTFQREQYRGLFFSIWYFVFDPERRTLRYASAGSHFGMLRQPGSARFASLSGSNPPIGFEPESVFATSSHTAEPGCSLILMSDSACQVIEQGDSADALEEFAGPAHASGPGRGITEPLQVHDVVTRIGGDDGLEGDFSAIIFDF